jgi:hypothetical protein
MSEWDPVDPAIDNLGRGDGKRMPTKQIVILFAVVLAIVLLVLLLAPS